MDFYYLIVMVIVFLVYIFIIYSVDGIGKYPAPLPHSENPRREYKETVIYSLIVISYLIVDIFVLNSLKYSFFSELGFHTIIFLLIPLTYVRFRDHWTRKDLGFLSRVQSDSKWVVIVSLIFYTFVGFNNTLTFEIPWYILLIYFYSNAFLEEFLFRGVIQSKLERAFGQKKAIIFQAFFIYVNSYSR